MEIGEILSLDDVKADQASRGGGKFAGLMKLRSLIESYKEKYNLDIAVLQTYVIPLEKYKDYKESGKVSDDLVNQAMQYAVKLKGKVAVRSHEKEKKQEIAFSRMLMKKAKGR